MVLLNMYQEIHLIPLVSTIQFVLVGWQSHYHRIRLCWWGGKAIIIESAINEDQDARHVPPQM